MLDVVKCENGHFYDKNTYSKCPHCVSCETSTENTMEYRKKVSLLAQIYIENISERHHISMQHIVPEENFSVEHSSEKLQISSAPTEKTISFVSDSQNNYLVTGWLVCISGPDLGYSFNLHYGYNVIGCDRANQINLNENSKAAQGVHCSIVYENRKNRFYLVPQKEQQTYLNGSCQPEVTELMSGDLLRIGYDEFEFIAFCKGDCKWNE